MTNPLGLPDDAILARPSPLRELLGEASLYVKPVTLEGPEWGKLQGQTLGLRSLSAARPVEALGRAVEWCLKAPKLDRGDMHLEGSNEAGALDLVTRAQTLHLALVDPKPPHASITQKPEEVLDLFTAEQVVWLFERYSEVQQERSPIKHLADPAAVKEVAAALGKGFLSGTSLKSFDAATLRSICLELADQLSKRTTPPSSDTDSPNS